jgi:hypothetical protein
VYNKYAPVQEQLTRVNVEENVDRNTETFSFEGQLQLPRQQKSEMKLNFIENPFRKTACMRHLRACPRPRSAARHARRRESHSITIAHPFYQSLSNHRLPKLK